MGLEAGWGWGLLGLVWFGLVNAWWIWNDLGKEEGGYVGLCLTGFSFCFPDMFGL